VISDLNKAVDLDVSYQKAFQVMARSVPGGKSSVDGYLMQSLYSSCEANIDQTKLAECLATGQALMDARLNGRFSSILNSTKPELTTAVTNINKSQKDESNQKVATAKKATDKGSVAEAAGTATPNTVRLRKKFKIFQRENAAFRFLIEVFQGLTVPYCGYS
jgi:uncharacterized protein YecT (DUF1311 family)